MIIKKSLAESVSDKIKNQILSGFYKSGDKLPIEPELMKDFGVGRSSIREAVKLLVNSGYLRVQQGLGTFVEDASNIKNPLDKNFSKANLEDLDEVRRLLEMKIAEKAAFNRSEEDIRSMKAYLLERKLQAVTGNLEECVKADLNFHTSIAIASKNEIFFELYRTAAKHLKKWFMNHYSNTGSFIETQALHENLLQAIIDKKPNDAWAVAEKIIKWH
ncbi:transcriptional regulator, GntR family [Pseudopedobacter saltans DSM 12145]|uniref:Transcriptional regulator, GntR family n=1 Tax=Pseudopedobacter saltans (strain ATCC 51119 / DSM 12145 / JCM 21818 / CCUG 39354 / LMG 10337 / NBRC 100064 / NCIMB 13643) TaxID=762903 RepID=F0S926_PSESL|nr:FadR/GntR family transcriptional regulator [Pseudopedobacter saltans]ADY51324.1 transcriptional regulator, GntR family [Pseudopedobacter saltans DSM 12145]